MKIVANSALRGDILKGKVILGFYTLDEELMIFYDDNTCSILRWRDGYGQYDFAHDWDGVKNPEYIAFIADDEFGLSAGDPQEKDSLAGELILREKNREFREFREYVMSKAKFEHGLDIRFMYNSELFNKKDDPDLDVDKLIFDLYKEKMEKYPDA